MDLDVNLPNCTIDPLNFLNFECTSPFTLEPCTPRECFSILVNLKNTKQDKDCVPISLLKPNSDILSIVISDIINQCMRVGRFPDSLKIAKIIPIHKRGDARYPSNYRPISLLPYLSKVFEKIIHIRLTNYLNFNNILSPHQFGFRKQISTLDAITNFTELIYQSLNNKNSILNVLVDYSKAFDTVNHSILLKKLYRYGVRGKPLQLIASYLQDRQQFVSIRNFKSKTFVTNISVPQGSVLGPLLFLIYVNEIPNLSQYFVPTMFADDCTLSFTSNSVDVLISECNSDLATFKAWSDANRLTINIDKTNCLFISNVASSAPTGSILLNNHELDFVPESRFLGVLIDQNLRFDKHINYVCGKISKCIGILFRIRPLLPEACLRNLYFSLIHPYILYCLPVFGASYSTHLEPLRILQKRAVRLISNAAFLDHTDPLFFNNKILKLDDQYKLSIGCFAFKNPNLIATHVRPHSHFTRNREIPLPPFERLRSTQQSVIFNVVKVWNDVPESIKQCRSLHSFKFKFKELLLSRYLSVS